MRDRPASALATGITMALAGAGLIATGPVIIAAGNALCLMGAGLITFAVFITGIGIVIGVAGRSALSVKAALAMGGIIGGAGLGLTIAGIAMKGLGYVAIGGGIGLALGGGYVTLKAIRSIRNPEQRAMAESAIRAINELKNQTQLGADGKPIPVVVVDMDGVHCK